MSITFFQLEGRVALLNPALPPRSVFPLEIISQNVGVVEGQR